MANAPNVVTTFAALVSVTPPATLPALVSNPASTAPPAPSATPATLALRSTMPPSSVPATAMLGADSTKCAMWPVSPTFSALLSASLSAPPPMAKWPSLATALPVPVRSIVPPGVPVLSSVPARMRPLPLLVAPLLVRSSVPAGVFRLPPSSSVSAPAASTTMAVVPVVLPATRRSPVVVRLTEAPLTLFVVNVAASVTRTAPVTPTDPRVPTRLPA